MTQFVQSPQWLWLLLALPLLPLGAWWMAKRRERRLEAFVARPGWDLLNPSVSLLARRARMWLLLGAVAFAVVAAARPVWGSRERVVQERGIEVILAIDVSNSMLAEDVPPNRLEQAKTISRRIIGSFPGHRVGIVPFAGDAFLQCPLTNDYGIARTMIDHLSPRIIGEQGTDIGRAIEVARNAFSEGTEGGTRIIVFITDAEDHEGGVEEQVRLAAREGIRIFAIGLGTEEGAVVPDPQLSTPRNPVPLVGPGGIRAFSRLDTGILRMLSEGTGGESFIAAPGRAFDVDPLIRTLEGYATGEFGESRRVVREERFQIPLAIALALLLAEGFVGDRRRKRANNASAKSAPGKSRGEAAA